VGQHKIDSAYLATTDIERSDGIIDKVFLPKFSDCCRACC